MIKSCNCKDRMSKKSILMTLSKIDFFHFLGIKIYLHCWACEWFGMSYYNEFLQNVISKKIHNRLNTFIFIMRSCDEYFSKYIPWILKYCKNNYLWSNAYLLFYIHTQNCKFWNKLRAKGCILKSTHRKSIW